MHQTIPVTYIISGTPTQIPTKLSYEWNDEYEYMYNVNIVVTIEGVTYSAKNFIELLPQHIKIACCGSCRHGNYCPYGDQYNEIFCFKDKTFKDGYELRDEFDDYDAVQTRSRKILDYYDDYEPIDTENYYTYNSWGIE